MRIDRNRQPLCSMLCRPASGGRRDERVVPRVRHFAHDRLQNLQSLQARRVGGTDGPVPAAGALCQPVAWCNEIMIVPAKKSKPHWGARKIRELMIRKLFGDVRVPTTNHLPTDYIETSPAGRSRRRWVPHRPPFAFAKFKVRRSIAAPRGFPSQLRRMARHIDVKRVIDDKAGPAATSIWLPGLRWVTILQFTPSPRVTAQDLPRR